MVLKELIVDVERCTGCKLCVMACSYVKKGIFKPLHSRIKIAMKEDKMLNIPIVCFQCEKPPCAEVCPFNAIVKNKRTGIVEISSKLCVGCKACIAACPFEAMSIDYDEGIATKCDLCNGDPECVKVCTSGALQYRHVDRPILKISERHKKYLEALTEALAPQEVS